MLYQKNGRDSVYSVEVAAVMGLRRSTVCRATDNLIEKGLLHKDKSRGLFLTDKGIQYATHIEKRYTILTRFFHEMLDVDLETAQKDACGVEHVISSKSYRSICAFLREPAMG